MDNMENDKTSKVVCIGLEVVVQFEVGVHQIVKSVGI